MTPAPLPAEAIERFNDGLDAARSSGEPEPTAMTLSTRNEGGGVSSRTVLMKDFSADGFRFYTNTRSNKGRQLAAHPVAGLLFLWKSVERQVQVEGVVEPVTHEEADRYFAERPRGSQVGAWASQQSEPLDGRETLEAAVERYAAQFDGEPVPRPPHWSGYLVRPTMVEFWYGREYRLHDRFRFTLGPDGWARTRLYP